MFVKISEKQFSQVQLRQMTLVVILNNQMKGYRERWDQISTSMETRRKKVRQENSTRTTLSSVIVWLKYEIILVSKLISALFLTPHNG